ncbi:MAG: response regulator transcription factor [Armatimonadetes bacterium]|nr:response regulator transcription factor [Armatimonadota bacterium]
MKILIVDDEKTITDSVGFSLKKEGFEVTAAHDGETALRLARSERPDLILLDVMLPSMSGFDICRLVRKESDVPIILMTARAEEIDKVVGFEIGSDDYVTKPFSMRELIARVKAVLKRSASSSHLQEARPIHADGLEIDISSHTVHVRGCPITLSPKEFDLLVILASNRGKVMTRDVLLDRIWGEDAYIDTRTVDVHIRWLREKIEADPGHPQYILTVRGSGHKFGE